jgi:MFS family permease
MHNKIGEYAAALQDLPPEPGAIIVDHRSDVSTRFMIAYALTQYAAWLGIFAPVVLTIALKVSHITSAAEKGGQLAAVLAIGAFGAMAAAPIWGAISDRTKSRFGRRKLWIVMGSLFLFVGLLIMAQSESIAVLGIGWLICQIGSNATQAALNAVMPDVVPDHQQGRMSALLGLTVNLAFLSAMFITRFTTGDNMAMFLVPWLPGPIAIAFFLTTFKDRPAGAVAPFRATDLLRTFWVNPILYPDFAWAFASRFLLFFANAFFMTYQLYFLTDHIGIGENDVVGFMFYCALMTTVLTLVFTPLSGYVSDRIGRRKPLVLGAGLVAAAGLLGISTATVPVQFILWAAVFGIGIAVYYAVDIALCASVLPHPDDAAKDMAVIQIANSLPQSLAPMAAPLILAIGAGVGPNYPAIFVAASIAGVIGALAILPIRKSR